MMASYWNVSRAIMDVCGIPWVWGLGTVLIAAIVGYMYNEDPWMDGAWAWGVFAMIWPIVLSFGWGIPFVVLVLTSPWMLITGSAAVWSWWLKRGAARRLP